MSNLTCGAIYLNSDKIDVKREENIAFDCVAQTNSLRMGIVLGGNIHEYFDKACRFISAGKDRIWVRQLVHIHSPFVVVLLTSA